MKKLISIAIVLMLVFGTVPMAFAAEEESSAPNDDYTVNSYSDIKSLTESEKPANDTESEKPESTVENTTESTALTQDEPTKPFTNPPYETAPSTTEPPECTQPTVYPTEPYEPVTESPTYAPTCATTHVAPAQDSTDDPTESPTVAPTAVPTVAPTAATEKKEPESAVGKNYSLNLITATLRAGKSITLYVNGATPKQVQYSSNNKKVATVSSKGKVVSRRLGVAVITAKIGKKKLYFSLKVITNPKLSETKITVRKGRYKKITITDKSPTESNKYKNTKIAKAIGKRTKYYFKVKGLRKGITKLRIRVNGKWLNLKVKVI